MDVLGVLRKAGASVSYTGDKVRDIEIAVFSADPDKVSSLIDQGLDPNSKTKSGKSLLDYAVENKWPEIVELLVKKGAQVNTKDPDGWTVMMKAAFENQTEMIKAFEQAGVKVDYTGNLKSDLLLAVLFSNQEKAKELLAKGADVNGRYRYNSPLLNYSVYKNDQPMTKLLLDNKANPDLLNDKGFGSLIIALDRGNAQLVKLLIERRADVNVKTPGEGWSAFLYVVKLGDIDLVKTMLSKGAQADAKSVILSEGRNPNFKNLNFPEITALLKPEVLRRQMLRAQAAVEAAQSPQDYAKAISEYNIAKDIAPESPEIYYNLGMVQDKAGLYPDALNSLHKYLELSPNATDAQAVKDMIYKLEYKRDQK
jgi:ankyrin repeat protein